MIRVKSLSPPSPWVIEENPQLDPEIAARLRAALTRHDENMTWYEDHAAEIRTAHSGRYVAVADGRVFAGATPAEADDLARAALPTSWEGAFRIFIHPPVVG